MRYRSIYRIPSARWANWDYTRGAWYFVTICTYGMECFFGKVACGRVKLSAVGEIIVEEWLKTPAVRPGVELDEWQVMPNHFHGILRILDPETPRRGVSGPETSSEKGASPRTETFQRNVSTKKRREKETSHAGVSTLKANSLGAIIGQFKAACTRRIWAERHRRFGWQARFFDRAIRNPDELEKIRAYIRHNPLMWDQEMGKPPNLEL